MFVLEYLNVIIKKLNKEDILNLYKLKRNKN